MAKKNSTAKSTQRAGSTQTRQRAVKTAGKAGPAADVRRTERRPAPAAADIDAQREHYYGEPPRPRDEKNRAADPGSVEQETLSQDAPYNRTYGGREFGQR